MGSGIKRFGSAAVSAAVAILVCIAIPASASAGYRAPPVNGSVNWIPGYNDPGTPDDLDHVGILKFGDRDAPNVLVLNPGTSAGSGYFAPLARTIVDAKPHWQVWSVERRENQLEDQSVLDQFKRGNVTVRRFFNYYLGWLANSHVSDHFQLIPDDDVAFARGWGMNVEIQDLHRVVHRAGRHGRNVVMGGHSLGGTITTAYATWNFGGRPGGDDLSGLVFIDGGSGATGITKRDAQQQLDDLQTSSPWLAFGGIAAPYLGLFSTLGSSATVYDPDERSVFEGFPLLPPNIVPPVPVTNEAGFGYAVDTSTSPSNLIAAQVHAGHLAGSGEPRTWVRDGAITPIQRYARMLSGAGLEGVDGNAWYHPARLTLDGRSVADGNANAAQHVLDVHAIHGDDLDTPIYAFGAALGDGRVIEAAQTLAAQSGIPDDQLTLVDRHRTYAHNDPNSADPKNAFVAHLLPFLGQVAQH